MHPVLLELIANNASGLRIKAIEAAGRLRVVR
jgi:hypothetical protein